MPAKYRIGIIGHTGRGDYGHGIDLPWAEIEGCEVVAVADADEAGRKKAAERHKVAAAYADYRELLNEAKVNIVSICPRWLDQHAAMCRAAAERGVHIFMEKPFCRTLAEADAVIAACEQHKVKLAIAYQTRYGPKLRLVKQLIDEGRIGRLLEIRGRGKEDHRGGGEDLWVLGSHLINVIHYLAGDPQWCLARVEQGGEPVNKSHVKPGNEELGPLAGDWVTATYGMGDGVIATFNSVRGANEQNAANRFCVQVFGSKGIIEILHGYLPEAWLLEDPHWSPGRSKKTWKPISSAGVDVPEPIKAGGLHPGNVLACRDLLAAIEQDRQPEASMYEGRTTNEMIAAVFESHRTGGLVTLPLKTRENPLTLL